MNRYLDWIDQARRDLEKAGLDLRYEYWEWACFTAQQAAEKAVKALLMSRNVEAWGHGITPMLRHCPDLDVPGDIVANAQRLDSYYIPTRYPNGFAQGKPADYYGKAVAQGAVDAAREILRYCEARLPGHV